MDLETFTALIGAGETFETEFKRCRSSSDLPDRELVEAVVCLANGSGGHVIIGVEDDGTVSGCRPRHGETTDADRLRALIINRTDPGVATDVHLVDHHGQPVVVISVPDMATPVGTTDGLYKRRALRADGSPECVPYRPHEMLAAGFSTHGRDYAEVAARGARIDDLDADEFQRFRSLCQAGGDPALSQASDLDICRALRLLVPGSSDEITLGAVLLFGTSEAVSRYVPTAESMFQEMRDGSIIAASDSRAPLFKTAADLFDRLERSNTEQEVMDGLLRVTVPRIPRKVMRESVANALVHRDYSELGPVHVRLTEDELRVASPGGLPRGVTLRNLLAESRPRSVVLADAFKRAGIVDRAGRGIPDMYTAMLRAGRAEPDYSTTTDQRVVVTVATSDADLDLVRFVLAFEADGARRLTLDDLRILHEIKTVGAGSLAEVAESLSTPLPALRATTTRLVEAGLLESHGTGRGRQLHLSAGFYELARDRNAYVRVRPADPIQQEQAILSYVQAYGSITRGQAADLCRISPTTARALLRHLVATGALVLRGERRLAHYVLSGGVR